MLVWLKSDAPIGHRNQVLEWNGLDPLATVTSASDALVLTLPVSAQYPL
jgi:hypothetical protein